MTNDSSIKSIDQLVNLLVTSENAEELKISSESYPSITLTQRQLCDLELLMNGGFSPLTGFMCQQDYNAVLTNMRLADNSLWPIPITLDLSEEMASRLSCGDRLALRDPEGFMLAVMSINEMWQPDKEVEASAVYSTTDKAHPGVHYLMHETGSTYVGGNIEGIQLPIHYDFENLWDTPLELRALFEKVAGERCSPFRRASRYIVCIGNFL